MTEWQPGLFALPAGVDFAAEFVSGLMQRMRQHPPEAMARITILANASRTLTAIRQAFDDIDRPLLLPRMRVITDLGMESPAGEAHEPQDISLAPPLARRLQLARLVAQFLRSRPDLQAGHSVATLTASLSQLMAEMQSEGLDAQALELIDPADHARHWQNALAFLRIAAGFHLSGPAMDRPARQRAAAEALALDWAQGRNLPADPVIVAGSTGSHGATRLFMQAVAALPNGAVVLPGFDSHQPQAIWERLDDGLQDHPQARFAPLIREFGQPQPWSAAQAPSSARNALVSLALRPAPMTDQWIAEGPLLPDLHPACAGLTLIEADQPGDEAEAIALVMRDAAQQDRMITLIAADRELIRRVVAALDRWHIRPDDSAGQPLDLTAPGLLLRHVAALFGQKLTIDRLLVVLKHPLTASGSAMLETREARRQARELELHLRAHGPAFPDGNALREWGSKGDDPSRPIWAEWLAALLDRIARHADDHAPRPLSGRLSDLREWTEALAAGPQGDAEKSQLWQGKPGQMARAVMDHLAEHAGHGPDMGPADFTALLLEELRAPALRGDADTHPLLRIRGPREARIFCHGDVILSGLNETGWPQALAPDPWLSRQMRADAGLTLPERVIGLAAHDFQQGIAARRVVLTRARRNAEAETIPSRWLNRLTNLMAGLPDKGGPELLAAMRERGRHWLDMAQALAQPASRVAPARRPSPIPPAPPFAELPVTDIGLLIRDPYAVYAKRVLGLRPLPPLRPEPDAALRGITLHEIVQKLLLTRPDADTPPDILREHLLSITAQVLGDHVPWPSARIFWQARIGNIADQIVADELQRLAQGRPHVIEQRGRLALPGLGFTLTARPDRIDLLQDGRAVVYDYKSGKPPSDAQMAHFDKQLVLEAAMARRGGFDAIGPVDVAALRYIQLGGDGKTHPRQFDAQMEQENWEGFIRMIGTYLRGEAGFTALRAPELVQYSGDYAHLSRLGEWTPADEAQPERVGSHE